MCIRDRVKVACVEHFTSFENLDSGRVCTTVVDFEWFFLYVKLADLLRELGDALLVLFHTDDCITQGAG